MVSNVGIGGWKVASGEGGVASSEWGASLRACEAIQLVVQEEAGLPRRFALRNDGVGTRSFAMAGGTRLALR